MNKIARYFITPIFAVVIAISCLACIIPAVAHAATIPNNESGKTLSSIADSDTMALNKGFVTTNNGTIETNEGTVTTNYGTIINNYGIVPTNNGTIINNYSVNVGTTSTGSEAKIINNYLGGYADRLEGENNYYRIEAWKYPWLDWSLNPSNFTSPLYLYIGAQNNPDGLRGATFKVKEGYAVTLNSTTGAGFTITDNQDGTYTINVTDESLLDINLKNANNENLFDVKTYVNFDVKASPSNGGTIYLENTPFQPGNYDSNRHYSFTAVANKGYRFVGWESSDYHHFAHIELSDNQARVDIMSFERPYTIELTANFEKVATDDTSSNTGDNNENGNLTDGSGENKTLCCLQQKMKATPSL